MPVSLKRAGFFFLLITGFPFCSWAVLSPEDKTVIENTVLAKAIEDCQQSDMVAEGQPGVAGLLCNEYRLKVSETLLEGEEARATIFLSLPEIPQQLVESEAFKAFNAKAPQMDEATYIREGAKIFDSFPQKLHPSAEYFLKHEGSAWEIVRKKELNPEPPASGPADHKKELQA